MGGDCLTSGNSSSKVFHVDNKKPCACYVYLLLFILWIFFFINIIIVAFGLHNYKLVKIYKYFRLEDAASTKILNSLKSVEVELKL